MITTAPPSRGKNTSSWCGVPSFDSKLRPLYRASLNVSRLTSSRWVPLQSAHTIDWTCHPPRIFRLFLNHDCEPRFARGTFAGSRVVQKNDAEFHALSCSKRLVFGFLCGASGFPWLSRDFPGWISRSRERSLSEAGFADADEPVLW